MSQTYALSNMNVIWLWLDHILQIKPDPVFPVYFFQDQRVGEPENHRSSSRQSAGPAVWHVRGETGSTPTKQQTGECEIYHLNKKQRLNLH